jgi:diguanylate cyclase (GGDEF)-like protein
MSINKQEFGLNPNFSIKDNSQTGGEIDFPTVEAAEEVFQTLVKAKQEAVIDRMTGCYNRSYFEIFKDEHFNPDRGQVGLVFMDLNNLKTTNDEKGHKAGDALIKETARLLKANFRRDDIPIRHGGDEFVVICRDYTGKEDFENELISTVKEKFSESPVDLAIGVAVYDKRIDTSLDDTLKRADQRMYEDKRSQKENKQ